MNIQQSLLTLAAFLFTFISCEDNVSFPTSKKGFAYDAATGVCKDKGGNTGLNVPDLAWIRATKDCECVDLSGQKLVYLLDVDKIDDFMELGHHVLLGYNFKGARFDEAEVYFNYIREADFSGADLHNIQYGYAQLEGRVDAFTKLPEEGVCEVLQQRLNCSR